MFLAHTQHRMPLAVKAVVQACCAQSSEDHTPRFKPQWIQGSASRAQCCNCSKTNDTFSHIDINTKFPTRKVHRLNKQPHLQPIHHLREEHDLCIVRVLAVCRRPWEDRDECFQWKMTGLVHNLFHLHTWGC